MKATTSAASQPATKDSKRATPTSWSRRTSSRPVGVRETRHERWSAGSWATATNPSSSSACTCRVTSEGLT